MGIAERDVVDQARDCVVAVIDTGVPAPAYCAIERVGDEAAVVAGQEANLSQGWRTRRLVVVADASDDDGDENDDDFLDPYAGHGVFIAGIVHAIAPAATIVSQRAMRSYGDVDDAELARAIALVAARVGRTPPAELTEDCWPAAAVVPIEGIDAATPLVVNLSCSGYCEDDDPPVATRSVLSWLLHAPPDGEAPAEGCGDYRYRERRDVAVVASAGNDGSGRITWPAGLDDVVAVAALDGSRPAWFTNFGDWVTACAQGTDVVSRFYGPPSPPAARYSDRDDYAGWASWSGTSFAAPVVAAALAQDVIAGGGEPADAVDRVVRRPELLRLVGLGTVVNVL